MRNRIYITSVINSDNELFINDTAACNSSNNKYKNVLIFVPHLHAMFFNGKRYGSMNEINNDSSVSSIFKLGICVDDNINSIYLAQQQIYKKFNATSIIVSGSWVRYHYNNNSHVYQIYLNIGDRAQVFLDYRSGWHWEYNPNESKSAIVDNNYIIHGIKTSTAPQEIKLYNTDLSDEALVTFKVFVFNSENNMFMTLQNIELAETAIQNDENASYDEYMNDINSGSSNSRVQSLQN